MSLLDQLKDNKGTVSSALGKKLAKCVLDGDSAILSEAIELCCYELDVKTSKNVRAGAAKIVELVAEKKPELVADFLDDIYPALSADEPQTRWMVFMAIGYCAHLNESVAEKTVAFAEKYIAKKEGLCITSSADLFLGRYGAISEDKAQVAFPLLATSADSVIKNEHDWILEAFTDMFINLNPDQQEIAANFARLYSDHERKATQKRAAKILKLYAGNA